MRDPKRARLPADFTPSLSRLIERRAGTLADADMAAITKALQALLGCGEG